MISRHEALSSIISQAFENRAALNDGEIKAAVDETVAALDRGELRAAEPLDGEWVVHAWVKEAILLYFAMRESALFEAGSLNFFDKIPTKRDWQSSGVRAVPPAVARYGSYIAPGAILMPSFVNIGAYVGAGSMVDTWATVGSCAQIGAGVHLSGGVGVGGVLEPANARPVIIEDGAFIGSRCVIVEGVLVEREAVLGAGVVLTSSTPIIDVSREQALVHRGCVPARSVVIPGTQTKKFPAGTYGTPCALIIGQRSQSTDRKTTLNAALRDYGVAV